MREIAYLKQLVRFSLKANPALYLATALAVFSVGVELLAMTSLFPLATLANGQALSAGGHLMMVLNHLGWRPSINLFVQLFILLFSLRIITQLLSQGLSFFLGKRLHAQLSSFSFATLLKDAALQEIEQHSMGYFISLAGDESFRASAVVISLTQLIASSCLALFYFAAIAYASMSTGIGVLIFLAVCFVCLFKLFQKSGQLGNRQIEQSRSASSVFIDALNGLRAVRAFMAEDYVVESYRVKIFAYTRTLFWIDYLASFARLGPVFILLCGLFLYSLSVGAAVHGGGAFSFVVTMILFLMRFFPAVGQSLNIFIRLISDSRAGKDVTGTMAGLKQEGEGTQPLEERIEKIELRDVEFAYEEGKPIIHGLSIEFRAGQSYALIGPSGSGKSTLVDLLLKFYRPQSGELLVNGRSLSGIAEKSLRRHVTLLGQETTIFNDTILNNVRFGCEKTLDEVRAACRLACIEEVILNLPGGYSSPLNYQGSNLSGGQRQRLGVARALLRQPDVLLLDECTSALDVETRDQLVDNILKAFKDRIIIFITHDPAIVARVDQLVDLRAMNQAAAVIKSLSA